MKRTKMAKTQEKRYGDLTSEERREIWEQVLEEMAPLIQKASDDVVPVLQKAKMWYFPSMPAGMNHHLLRLAHQEPEATVEQIEQIFIHYFDENNCKKLEGMVLSWFDSPIFSRRRHIIEDALDAHIAGKFTLLIPALWTQVEGILSEYLHKPAGSVGKLLEKVFSHYRVDIGTVKALHALGDGIVLSLSSYPFLINKGGFGDDFTVEKYGERLKSDGVNVTSLNRNAILHGIQVDYGTKANSLRMFLLLDSIHGIINK